MKMNIITTKNDFKNFVQEVESRKGFARPIAFGIGLAHKNKKGKTLDTYFPMPQYKVNYGTSAILADAVGHLSGNATYTLTKSHLLCILAKFKPFLNDGESHANIDLIQSMLPISQTMAAQLNKKDIVVSFFDSGAPKTVSDAYLRLHLLSLRHVKPHEIDLKEISNILPINAWTNEGPIDLDEITERKISAFNSGQALKVDYIDKFPAMLDYVIPLDVRIVAGERVKLGIGILQYV